MTQLIKHSEKKVFEKTREVLRDGGVILHPADTCFGFMSALSSEKAYKDIFAMKRRTADKAVSLAFADIAQLDHYCIVTPEVRRFLKKYSPGYFTLILPIKEGSFPKYLLTPQNTVGARIPKDPLMRKLAQSIDEPLITTSANLAGEPPIYTFKEIEKFLHEIDIQPELVIQKERIAHIEPSTIIDTTCCPWQVIRSGKFIFPQDK